ncbi:hypothetical protein TB6_23040, partial [Xanthomonas perforans]
IGIGRAVVIIIVIVVTDSIPTVIAVHRPVMIDRTFTALPAVFACLLAALRALNGMHLVV